MTHKISMAAFQAAGDPDAYPEPGSPGSRSSSTTTTASTGSGFQAAPDEMLRRGLESPYGERLKDWEPDPAHFARITTRVPCSDYFAIRDQALLAHATQIDPEGPWFACPLEVHQAAWPTEDFELAISHVESSIPETDLFAGVRELAERMAP